MPVSRPSESTPSSRQPGFPDTPDGSLEIPIVPDDGTIDPLDYRNRKASSRQASVRRISPERSPLLALGAGVLVALSGAVIFLIWSASTL